MIGSLRKHAEGHIEKHKLNVEVILQKPVLHVNMRYSY